MKASIRPKPDAMERTSDDQNKDDRYAEDDGKSQPLLHWAWRQAREDEMLFLWDKSAVRRGHICQKRPPLYESVRSAFGDQFLAPAANTSLLCLDGTPCACAVGQHAIGLAAPTSRPVV